MFFFSSRRRHTRFDCDWSSDVCSSDLVCVAPTATDAERWLADVATLAGETAALYPQREALGAEEAHFEIAGERVETLEALLRARVRILVTTARATAERTGVPAALAARGM